MPQGKIVAKVNEQNIYEKDINHIKLIHTDYQKTAIGNLKKESDTSIQKEYVDRMKSYQASDADILNDLIREKIILSECKKKGLLVSMDEAIKNQKDTLTQMRNYMENGTPEEKEGV